MKEPKFIAIRQYDTSIASGIGIGIYAGSSAGCMISPEYDSVDEVKQFIKANWVELKNYKESTTSVIICQVMAKQYYKTVLDWEE